MTPFEQWSWIEDVITEFNSGECLCFHLIVLLFITDFTLDILMNDQERGVYYQYTSLQYWAPLTTSTSAQQVGIGNEHGI